MENHLTELFSFNLEFINPYFVCISDQNGKKSLTNCAEEVVQYLKKKNLLGERRLLYKDSTGIWDELVHDQTKFLNFKSINRDSLHRAFVKAIMFDNN